MWAPRVAIASEPAADPLLREGQPRSLSYASGWFVSDYRGAHTLWHTDEFPGFASRVTLVPDTNLGIAIRTNQEDDTAFDAATNLLLDAFLDLPSRDWASAFGAAARADAGRKRAALRQRLAQRTQRGRDVPDAPRFAGLYRDRWCGDVHVTQDGGGLRLRFAATPSLVGRVERWAPRVFLVRWDDRSLRGDALITFVVDDRGVVEARMERAFPSVASAFDYQDLLLVRVDA